ncbi:hypothetical protein EIP86_003742 [Pleurotus ostreatoroseus]|nr:hypothetical protein EIP86_003742 [Pleurotus ostreatoroseus]
MFSLRQKGVEITDQRVRLTTEVLQGIRLIKYYAWEQFYVSRINDYRSRELKAVRGLAVARSSIIAVVTIVPVLAAVLSFITYALSGHELNIATIFTSLQFFNETHLCPQIIRTPLIFFPMVMANVADAAVATRRISQFLTAEELAEPYKVDPTNEFAVDVDGSFQWETAYKDSPTSTKPKKDKKAKQNKSKGKGKRCAISSSFKPPCLMKKSEKEPVLPVTTSSEEKEEQTAEQEIVDDKPFELADLKLQIPKGSFVAIVGRVGSGKSSLLQSLIGEMRKTRGHCTFSSSVAYVPQTAWIMNATLRENITFGRPEDDKKFDSIVQSCSLERDLEMLPQGQYTEIGEKGINLSGGQKARVSLARAAYSGADIILMDDSLSAVDAFVGKSILENCLLSGPLAGKTRVLVTHALHVLDKTDYIYVMDNGAIVEQGTFNIANLGSQDLMADSVLFSHVMEEYGTQDKDKDEEIEEKEGEKEEEKDADGDKSKDGKATHLMQEEERLTGSVSNSVYAEYFRYAGGLIWALIIVTMLTLYQGSSVANNLFLGFWTSQSIHGFKSGDYMGTYAGLGAAIAVGSFALFYAIR